MAINKVEVFNIKPVPPPSIEKNPLFEKYQKEKLEVEKNPPPPLPEEVNTKPGSKLDVVA
ncbi:hypothetical protein DRQ09_02785 [candidate division KSB1 bacterium]|nr:MAG: hypothetical protein DRQ09_02785 [candidate division KSB1 bacterium]